MKIVLMILLLIASIVLIANILFQSGNSAGLSGSIGGGAEQLFGKSNSQQDYGSGCGRLFPLHHCSYGN